MPVVGNETAEYGYEGENRYFVNCFVDGQQPSYNFYDGLAVTRTPDDCLYERRAGASDRFKPDGLEDFVPQVAKGTWKG
ncbi:MAG: hypothetical protein WKF84_17900 [Pyrinomonadaceae bacterium]